MLTYDQPEVRKLLFAVLRQKIGTHLTHWYGTVEGENKHFIHMITALSHFNEANMDKFDDLQDLVIQKLKKCRHLPKIFPIAEAFFNTDEEAVSENARFINLLREEILKLVNQAHCIARIYFFKKHQEQFEKDKQGFLGFFCQTEINRSMSLKEIIAHGVKNNNRTRRICMELDWMTPDGELTSFAPR